MGGSCRIIAVGFVTWMIFWMGKTARSMKCTLQTRLDSALVGAGWGVVILAMLSVGREGIETALFVWATVASIGGGWEPVIGALLGILAAAVLGFLLYRGIGPHQSRRRSSPGPAPSSSWSPAACSRTGSATCRRPA